MIARWLRCSALSAGLALAALPQSATGAATGAAAGAAEATPSNPPGGHTTLRRELRIGADVMRAALTDLLPESRRVAEVEAGYLAGQGALVIVDLASPWFGLDNRRLDTNAGIAGLEDIPDMVHDILRELNLGLSSRQVEELDELRDIRETTRSVRAEQRSLRAELRARRRALLQADGAQAEALEREIDTLQASLAAAEEEERALERDAGSIRDTLQRAEPEVSATGEMPSDLDLAVAEAVCSYGATFKSLARDAYLNVLVRRHEGSRYYVFRMAPVRDCQAAGLTAEALLEASPVYDM